MKKSKGKYKQGFFKPRHPEKYKGDATNIVYRSSFELKAMMKFDEHPNIIQWSSEETIIPYLSPIDGKWHRYYPDFHIKTKEKDGKITESLIEVKPKRQTIEPRVKPKRQHNKTYITEVVEWGKNQAKWKAAREYCADRKWQFHIITEVELGIK